MTIKEAIEIILHGNELEAKKVSKTMRKLVYFGDSGKYEEIKEVIEDVLKVYPTIQEEWRREIYISAISIMYFLHDKYDKKPDYFFPLLLSLLENPNGTIRYCAYKMLVHDLGPLTVHLRIPDYEKSELDKYIAISILSKLHKDLMILHDKYFDKKYKKYKYVQDLPASTYKTVEMALYELDDMRKPW
jgi:hypothetical protein